MRLTRLLRLALLGCGLLLAAACSAHSDAGASASAAATATAATKPVVPLYSEGNQYATLKLQPNQPQPSGPVVMVEVFSYGCPHCAEFAPLMDKLRTELPKGVQVRYMPAVFSQEWMPFAQAFYAASQLGVLAQTHDALFKDKLAHYPLNSLDDLADWYARHGVDRDKFMAAATSTATTQQLNKDLQTEFGWGVDSTPTLVVGRLASDAPDAAFVGLIRSNDVTSYAELQHVGVWMAQKIADKP